MKFKKLLYSELCRQGLSCQKLGKMSGVTPRLISYYAKGQRTPSIYAADKILKALGVTMVLGEEQEEASDE